MIIESKGDHAKKWRAGAKNALMVAKGDHPKHHRAEERLNDSVASVTAHAKPVLAFRSIPAAGTVTPKAQEITGGAPNMLIGRGSPPREEWRRCAKETMGGQMCS